MEQNKFSATDNICPVKNTAYLGISKRLWEGPELVLFGAKFDSFIKRKQSWQNTKNNVFFGQFDRTIRHLKPGLL